VKPNPRFFSRIHNPDHLYIVSDEAHDSMKYSHYNKQRSVNILITILCTTIYVQSAPIYISIYMYICMLSLHPHRKRDQLGSERFFDDLQKPIKIIRSLILMLITKDPLQLHLMTRNYKTTNLIELNL